MEDEKEQLHRRIDRMQKKVQHDEWKSGFPLFLIFSALSHIVCWSARHSFSGGECSKLRQDVASSSEPTRWKRERAITCTAKTGTEEPGKGKTLPLLSKFLCTVQFLIFICICYFKVHFYFASFPTSGIWNLMNVASCFYSLFCFSFWASQSISFEW